MVAASSVRRRARSASRADRGSLDSFAGDGSVDCGSMNGWYAQGSKERGWNILQGSTRHCVENDRVSIEIDPVCGMEVETTTATNSFEYEGKTYWFCGKGCRL